MSPVLTCPTCGERIQPSIGECLYCSQGEAASADSSAAPPALEPSEAPQAPEPREATPLPEPLEASKEIAPVESGPVEEPVLPEEASRPPSEPSGDSDRSFGLLLFDAEEHLARGSGEKALVLASKAIKDRPDNVTARALYERARRELLRGRRREKLEARIQEAQALFDRGSFDEAERIATSALKLIPDHAVALELFGRLKERRLTLGTAEAEAERDLERLARAQAGQALQAARRALAASWERRAMMAVRRGLRLVPDDAELLALLRQLQRSGELSDEEMARRRALASQIRAGLDFLGKGRLEESLKILRAVLREDPDNARAQAAIQDVRKAWLRRAGAEPSPPAAPPPAAVASMPPPEPAPKPAASAAVSAHGAAPPPSRPPHLVGAPRPRAIPVEILLPRARRRATPLSVVLGSAAVVLGLLFYLTARSASPPPLASPATPVPVHPPSAPASPEVEPRGPLTGLDPDVRRAIEESLALYARALESQEADLLARARPDLSTAEREERLAPFRGALNVATDLRVLDVVAGGDQVVVSILRTDVIVGGRGGSGPPVEETLRFERRQDGWVLRGSSP